MKNDFETTTKLYDVLKEHDSYSVPRIIAFFPEEMAIVMEESDGKTLMSLIGKKGKGYPKQSVIDELKQYCYALGGWLQTFQNLTRITSSQNWDKAEFINYINLRLSKLEKSRPCIRQEDTYRIQRYLEQLLQKAAEDKTFLCGVHGDLGLSNILVSSKKITVLDFPTYKIGSSYDDLTYVYMRIEYFLSNPLFRISVINKLQDAFLEGYKNGFDRKISLFVAYCMKHRINRLVDLSKIDSLSMINKIYQTQQFKNFLKKINRNIEVQ
jgi:tRNA A-37 threonylcarbamoyl transferase component Bud32